MKPQYFLSLFFLFLLKVFQIHAQKTSDVQQAAQDDPSVWLMQIQQLHHHGKRTQPLSSLRALINTVKQSAHRDHDLLGRASLLQAEIYFGFYRVEYFSTATDSALLYLGKNSLYGKAQYYLNRMRYYNYHTLAYKSQPYIYSIWQLLPQLSPDEYRRFSQTAFFSARINCYRNYDVHLLYKIVDSALAFISRSAARDYFEQQILLRAIGNAYMDKARPDNTPGTPWKKEQLLRWQRLAAHWTHREDINQLQVGLQ